MGRRVLITGGSGSIGTALRVAMDREGTDVVVLDVRATGHSKGDVRDRAAILRAARSCSGIVHLAAISRVARGEEAPDECRSINVTGTREVLSAAAALSQRPWVLFASSREIYGDPERLPVTEDAAPRPVNVYGRSKAEAEKLVEEARCGGLRAAVVRLSNVYGTDRDYADRVVPAFVRAALDGAMLEVSGTHRAFDFTHIDDVVRGLCAMMEILDRGALPPPIQLVTGMGVTLGELGRRIIDLAGSKSALREREAKKFDVSRFVGDPRRARALLGWEARVSLRDGLERIIGRLRAEGREELRAS